jgi:tetratricopeptide (TPR) repeat protein
VLLLPVLGFVDLSYHRYSLVADQWVYLPMIPLLAGAAWALTGARDPWPLALGSTLALACGLLAWNRGALYADPPALWQRVIEQNPRSSVAWNQLGIYWQDHGDARALDAFQRGAQGDDAPLEALINLGVEYAQLHQTERALAALDAALRLSPDSSGAMMNKGIVLYQAGRDADAIAIFRRALELEPDSSALHYNLARALFASGDASGCRQHLEEAVRLDPDNEPARRALLRLDAAPR